MDQSAHGKDNGALRPIFLAVDESSPYYVVDFTVRRYASGPGGALLWSTVSLLAGMAWHVEVRSTATTICCWTGSFDQK